MLSWKMHHRDGEIYVADFSMLTRADLSQLKKSEGWSRGINWGTYLQPHSEFTAYKLHINGNHIAQGLLAMAVREAFVELNFVEKSPSNRKPVQQFTNAGELLFAKACSTSFENNGDGHVLLQAKTGLVEYYIELYLVKGADGDA